MLISRLIKPKRKTMNDSDPHRHTRLPAVAIACAIVSMIGFAVIRLVGERNTRTEPDAASVPALAAGRSDVGASRITDKRVALVIGNASYAGAPALRNAVNDAEDVAAKLRGLGFSLIGNKAHPNVTRTEMARLIRDFGNAAGEGDTALFYFAGHGVAGNNDNWLLPVDDADIKVQEDVPDFAVSARSVLSRMEQRGSGINVVILDACRNNPLPDRRRSVAGTRGLARMTAPAGSFIAYAASPGQAAADGTGRNGTFTAALLALIDTQGIRIDDLFAEVGKRVRKATNGEQVPIRESNLEDVFYMRPGAPVQTAGLSPVAPPAAEPPLAAAPAPTIAPPPSIQLRSRDCADCPEMVRIPGGRFFMGDLSGKGESNEKPVHEVSIQPFSAGKFEVTFAEWDACLEAVGCSKRPDDQGWGRGNRPVINVNWEDAQQYVKWLSGKTGRRYRLLTESEWEYVARAGTTTEYSFGDCIDTGKANYDGNYEFNGCGKTGKYLLRTAAVGSYPANAWGLHDVHGNVWEWTQDCWHGSYAGAPTDGSAWTSGGDCARRVVRGGSWSRQTAVPAVGDP